MALSKNREKLIDAFTKKNKYKPEEAFKEMKELPHAKFDESVDIAIRLSVDKKKSNQPLKGIVSLPYSNGSKKRILAICNNGHEKECLSAGADFAGNDDYLKKIESGWLDFDVIVTTPEMMFKLSKLGRILGPKGLMPNPATGSVSPDIINSIKEIKKGRVEFKANSDGTMHCCIGKLSFGVNELVKNFDSYVLAVKNALRGRQNAIKGISVSSTMGVGFPIDLV